MYAHKCAERSCVLSISIVMLSHQTVVAIVAAIAVVSGSL